MNWKDRPELFVGNFKVNHNKDDYKPFIFAGTIKSKDPENSDWILQDAEWSYPVDDCTLIARPISDMTDEEKEQIWDTFPDNEYTWEEHRSNYEDFVGSVGAENIEGGVHSQSEVDELIDIIQGFAPAMLEALSIGVYPFEDETDVEYQPKLIEEK